MTLGTSRACGELSSTQRSVDPTLRLEPFWLHPLTDLSNTMSGPVLSILPGETESKQDSHNPCSHGAYSLVGKTDNQIMRMKYHVEIGKSAENMGIHKGLSDPASRQRGSPFEILCNARI